MNAHKKNNAISPPQVVALLQGLGRHIRIARKRRKMSEMKLAQLSFTSRATVQRLEAGEPGVGIGVLANVLWVLQLHEDLGMVANPNTDSHGKYLEEVHLPKRVRDMTGKDDKYDF